MISRKWQNSQLPRILLDLYNQIKMDDQEAEGNHLNKKSMISCPVSRPEPLLNSDLLANLFSLGPQEEGSWSTTSVHSNSSPVLVQGDL